MSSAPFSFLPRPTIANLCCMRHFTLINSGIVSIIILLIYHCSHANFHKWLRRHVGDLVIPSAKSKWVGKEIKEKNQRRFNEGKSLYWTVALKWTFLPLRNLLWPSLHFMSNVIINLVYTFCWVLICLCLVFEAHRRYKLEDIKENWDCCCLH